MTTLVGLVTVGAATVALAALLVLPGFRIAARLAAPMDHGLAPLILAVAASILVLLAIAAPLLAVGWFSGPALVAIAAVPAVLGLPAFASWLRRTVRGGGFAVWVVALAAPWIWLAVQAGYPPADRLQWYYAEVAGQLSEAGGIPVSVAEWGRDVRWLPDYLAFDVAWEGFRALLPGVAAADALSAWRVPVAALGLVALFAVLRLWVGRSPALLGTALIAGGTFFLAKFNAYKPEALGIVLGLLAVWLVVAGLRGGRRSWLLLGGLLFGADLAVHAIAAVALGLLGAGFGTAEWLFARRPRLALADGLVRAAVLGLALSVALGVGLQGRAIVASQVLAPAIEAGEDPTWTFFNHSTGAFADPLPEPPARPLAAGVIFPWDGFRVTSAFGWWLLAVVAIGMFLLAALGGRRGRSAVLGLALSGALLAGVIGFFALAFETYVPRWTGLVRFGQYVPLGIGLGVAFAGEGFVRLWARLAQRPVPGRLALVAAAVGAAWLIAWAPPRYAEEPRIGPSGLEALAQVRALARADDLVVSNVLTSGTVESFTGLEQPLEARQPLIEEPAFLAAANDLLREGHAFFSTAPDPAFVDRLGARWVLAADDPAVLGATATLGGSVAGLGGVDWLRPTWSGPGIALFEVRRLASTTPHLDRLVAQPLGGSTAVAMVGLAGLVVLLARLPPLRLRRAGTHAAVPAAVRGDDVPP